jgi:hypothetical protein
VVPKWSSCNHLQPVWKGYDSLFMYIFVTMKVKTPTSNKTDECLWHQRAWWGLTNRILWQEAKLML